MVQFLIFTFEQKFLGQKPLSLSATVIKIFFLIKKKLIPKHATLIESKQHKTTIITEK